VSHEIKEKLVAYLSTCVTERRMALFERVLAGRTHYVRLVLDGVHNTGDACAVMRSCECFGVQRLDMVHASAFRPTRGIAVGASKWIDLQVSRQRGAAYFDTLKQQGYRVACYRGDGDPSVPTLADIPLDRPVALVLAGEAGLSSAAETACDVTVRLPTVGFTRTFNLSVNAALCLAALTGRLREAGLPWALDDAARLDLALHWLAKMPKRIVYLTERFMETHGLDEATLGAMVSEDTARLLFGRKGRAGDPHAP